MPFVCYFDQVSEANADILQATAQQYVILTERSEWRNLAKRNLLKKPSSFPKEEGAELARRMKIAN